MTADTGGCRVVPCCTGTSERARSGAAGQRVTSSVRHSSPAGPGGLVTVAVAVGGGASRVTVAGRGSDGAPVLVPAAFADGDAEGSRGCGPQAHTPQAAVTGAAAGSRLRGPGLRGVSSDIKLQQVLRYRPP